ncbi:hypothetical protein M514_07936 [Trichuris suis]|uniref:Uncharacterized protein n=1 Tax=Trichuris suis TaxID=68888 RepID=A0A085NIZ1_9BILA|nr:hypothetical protein M513_07936 [Trichuris suis]KFD69437.1 hypothetical protein M514_07936 [Trichuris suis]
MKRYLDENNMRRISFTILMELGSVGKLSQKFNGLSQGRICPGIQKQQRVRDINVENQGSPDVSKISRTSRSLTTVGRRRRYRSF